MGPFVQDLCCGNDNIIDHGCLWVYCNYGIERVCIFSFTFYCHDLKVYYDHTGDDIP